MRAITSDKFPGVRTDIPPPLQYPVKVWSDVYMFVLSTILRDSSTSESADDTFFFSQASGFKFVEALINLFYGKTIPTRLGAAFSLASIGLSEPKKP